MTENKLPLVSIFSSVYNHHDFIELAIEGFLMQKTTFKFEIVIGEDCSTDGTREIVFDYATRYPDLIRVITSDENVGMSANAQRTIMALKGKYMAFCEGDDYWIDPYKLQKQFDFLEANSDYGLVHTDNSNLFDTSGKIIKSHKKSYYPNPPSGDVFEILIKKNFISTLTVFMKTDLIKQAKKTMFEKMDHDLLIDYAMWLAISTKTKIKYLDDITAVYRISEGTASRPASKKDVTAWLKKPARIQDFFIKNYNVKQEIVDEIISNRITNQLRVQFRKNKYQKKFDYSISHFKSNKLKDKLLIILYKMSSPRYVYVLVEMPSILSRKLKKVF